VADPRIEYLTVEGHALRLQVGACRRDVVGRDGDEVELRDHARSVDSCVTEL
jgi:hypothetical protein